MKRQPAGSGNGGQFAPDRAGKVAPTPAREPRAGSGQAPTPDLTDSVNAAYSAFPRETPAARPGPVVFNTARYHLLGRHDTGCGCYERCTPRGSTNEHTIVQGMTNPAVTLAAVQRRDAGVIQLACDHGSTWLYKPYARRR